MEENEIHDDIDIDITPDAYEERMFLKKIRNFFTKIGLRKIGTAIVKILEFFVKIFRKVWLFMKRIFGYLSNAYYTILLIIGFPFLILSIPLAIIGIIPFAIINSIYWTFKRSIKLYMLFIPSYCISEDRLDLSPIYLKPIFIIYNLFLKSPPILNIIFIPFILIIGILSLFLYLIGMCFMKINSIMRLILYKKKEVYDGITISDSINELFEDSLQIYNNEINDLSKDYKNNNYISTFYFIGILERINGNISQILYNHSKQTTPKMTLNNLIQLNEKFTYINNILRELLSLTKNIYQLEKRHLKEYRKRRFSLKSIQFKRKFILWRIFQAIKSYFTFRYDKFETITKYRENQRDIIIQKNKLKDLNIIVNRFNKKINHTISKKQKNLK